MNLNYSLLISFLIALTQSISFAQTIEKSKESTHIAALQIQQEKLEKAFIEKDTTTLSKILHDDLILGHSNGWTESKVSLLKTLLTSDIFYSEFRHLEDSQYTSVRDDLYNVSRYFHAKGRYKTYPFDLHLKTVEVWIKENDTWQLLTRQSVEVDTPK